MCKKLWEENDFVHLTDEDKELFISFIHPKYIDCEVSRSFVDYLEFNNILWTESIEVLPPTKFKTK